MAEAKNIKIVSTKEAQGIQLPVSSEYKRIIKKKKYSNDIVEWLNFLDDCNCEYWIAKWSISACN